MPKFTVHWRRIICVERFRSSSIVIATEMQGHGRTRDIPREIRKVITIDLKPYDWSRDVKNIQAPMFVVIGDADGVRYEHALELFRAKGGGKMGDIHGLPRSRLAIMPGTTHVGMMQRMDWLIPMITDFLDSDLDAAPPAF